MDNKNQEKLEKLNQQQLINSILGEKSVEHEALVEAAKKFINNPKIDINKEKNKIANKKYKEIEIKNNNEKAELTHKMLEEEVEIKLKKWQEEEKIQAEKRRTETEKILKELETSAKNRVRMEKKEREKFRKKYKQQEDKKANFLEQIKKMTENKAKNESEKKEQQLNNPVYNTLVLDRTKYDTTTIKNDITAGKEIVKKDKKVNFKMYNAIQRYVSTMEFYEKNKKILQRGREKIKTNSTIKKRSSKRKSFIENLISAVDHKKALENVENKRNERTNIRPRIID